MIGKTSMMLFPHHFAIPGILNATERAAYARRFGVLPTLKKQGCFPPEPIRFLQPWRLVFGNSRQVRRRPLPHRERLLPARTVRIARPGVDDTERSEPVGLFRPAFILSDKGRCETKNGVDKKIGGQKYGQPILYFRQRCRVLRRVWIPGFVDEPTGRIGLANRRQRKSYWTG